MINIYMEKGVMERTYEYFSGARVVDETCGCGCATALVSYSDFGAARVVGRAGPNNRSGVGGAWPASARAAVR
jgi:hypothetical protein